MRASTKRVLIERCEKSAYGCLGMAVYGPRLWAGVALVFAVIALAINEATPKGEV